MSTSVEISSKEPNLVLILFLAFCLIVFFNFPTDQLTGHLLDVVREIREELRRTLFPLNKITKTAFNAEIDVEIDVYSDGEEVEVIPYKKPPPEVITLD